jgi:hypothetical protein
MLAMAEGTPTAFRGIVGGLPRWVAQECTQPEEMGHIQVLLLPVSMASEEKLFLDGH